MEKNELTRLFEQQVFNELAQTAIEDMRETGKDFDELFPVCAWDSEETRKFREGQSVKLVFRPEDVCLSPDAKLPEGCRRLANGVVEQVNFVGAYERLTLRLDLVARQSVTGEPLLYNVTINTPEQRMGIPIIVTRTKPEAAATRLNINDRVAVGLTSFRILPNFTLASERAGRIVDTIKK